MRELDELFAALRESAFRRRFHLAAPERRYVATHGLDAILVQAEELIAKRKLARVLADWCPAYPGFFLYYPSRRQLPAALRAFVDFAKVNVS